LNNLETNIHNQNKLNDNYNRNNWYTCAILVRAIIDHVPPIFGFNSFPSLVNQIKISRSIKESLENLENSLRKKADTYLHKHIQKTEPTINETQILFKQDNSISSLLVEAFVNLISFK
jgi:hypothetical protein